MHAVAIAAALVLVGCGGAGHDAGRTGPDRTGEVSGARPPASSDSSVPPPADSTLGRPAVSEPGPAAAAPGASAIDRPDASDGLRPVAVRVPTLGVHSDLVDLGLAADGSLEVPRDPMSAGWFEGGGRPGGRGPTVIAGHVDSVTGPAIFYRLREIRVGDTIEIDTADGAASTYRVQTVDRYPQDSFPTLAVFGATRSDTLRLITCTGDYLRDQGGYQENLVVTAVPA